MYWDELRIDATLEGDTVLQEPPETNEAVCRILGLVGNKRIPPVRIRRTGPARLLSKREREEVLLWTGTLPPVEEDK